MMPPARAACLFAVGLGNSFADAGFTGERLRIAPAMPAVFLATGTVTFQEGRQDPLSRRLTGSPATYTPPQDRA